MIYIITVVIEAKTNKELNFTCSPVLGAHNNKKKAIEHYEAVIENRKSQLLVRELFSPYKEEIGASVVLKANKFEYTDYKETIKLTKWATK